MPTTKIYTLSSIF